MPNSVNVTHTGNFGDWEVYDLQKGSTKAPDAENTKTTTSGGSTIDGEVGTSTPAAIDEEWVVLEKTDVSMLKDARSGKAVAPRELGVSLPQGETLTEYKANSLKKRLENFLSRCWNNAVQSIGRCRVKPSAFGEDTAYEKACALYGDAIKKDMKSLLEASMAKALEESPDGQLTEEACAEIESKLENLERFHANLEIQLPQLLNRVKVICDYATEEVQQYLIDNLHDILSQEPTKTELGKLEKWSDVDQKMEEVCLAKADFLMLVSALKQPVKEDNVVTSLVDEDAVAPLVQHIVMTPLAKAAGMDVGDVSALCRKAVHKAFVETRRSVLDNESSTGTGGVKEDLERFSESVKNFVDEFVGNRLAVLKAVDGLLEYDDTKRLLRRAVLAGLSYERAKGAGNREEVSQQIASDFIEKFKGLTHLTSQALLSFFEGKMSVASLKHVVQEKFPDTLPAVGPLIDKLQAPITVSEVIEVCQKAEAEYLR